MITEGQKVVYAGDLDPFQDVGSTGKVLALSGDHAHVMWASGPKRGSVDLVPQYELLPERKATASLDPSLEVPLPAMQVRAAIDGGREGAVVAVLDEAGLLAGLGQYAEEALDALAARLRGSEHMAGVLSHLDAGEASSVLSRVSAALLLDLLSEG